MSKHHRPGRRWGKRRARWQHALRRSSKLIQIHAPHAPLAFLNARRRSGLSGRTLIITGGVLAVASLLILQYQIGGFAAPRPTLDGNAVVAVFAGKAITRDQLENRELSNARDLFRAGQSRDIHRRSFDSALFDVLDQIELDKQIDREIAAHDGLSREQARAAIVARVAPPRTVTVDEAQIFYQSHPELFARSGPKLHVREIVVGEKGLADRIVDRLRAHESFSQLASAYSVDPPEYRQHGGDLGWVSEKQMPVDWSDAVFNLSVGQISPIFRVNDQYYIAEVLEGPRYDMAPFSAVSSSVAGLAAQYEQKRHLLQWLTGLILQESLEVRVRSFVQPIGVAMKDLRQYPDQFLPYDLK